MGKVWGKSSKRTKQQLNQTYGTNEVAVEEQKDGQEILLKEIIAYDSNNGPAFNELGILEYEK